METLTHSQQPPPTPGLGSQRHGRDGRDGTELAGVSCTDVQPGAAPLSRYCFHCWNALRVIPTAYKYINAIKKKKAVFLNRGKAAQHFPAQVSCSWCLLAPRNWNKQEQGSWSQLDAMGSKNSPNHESTSPPSESALFPGSQHAMQAEIFLILVLLLVSPLGSTTESHGSTHLDVNFEAQEFLQYLAGNSSGSGHLGKF